MTRLRTFALAFAVAASGFAASGCSSPPAIEGFPTWAELEASPTELPAPAPSEAHLIGAAREPTDLRYRLAAGMRLRGTVQTSILTEVGAGVQVGRTKASSASSPTEVVVTKTWGYEVVEASPLAKVRARLEKIELTVDGRTGRVETDRGPEIVIALDPQGALFLLDGAAEMRSWAAGTRKEGQRAVAGADLVQGDHEKIWEVLDELASASDMKLALEHERVFPRLPGPIAPDGRWERRRTTELSGTSGINVIDESVYVGLVGRADGARLARVVGNQRIPKVTRTDADGDRTIVAPTVSTGAQRLFDPQTGLLVEDGVDATEVVIGVRTSDGDIVVGIRLVVRSIASIERVDG